MKKVAAKRSFRPARKPAVSKASAPAPSLADLKNLAGQMKGMLTWMSKERSALQDMLGSVNAILTRMNTPPEPAPADAPADGGDPAPASAEAHDASGSEHPEDPQG
jgi:hypothetical protein